MAKEETTVKNFKINYLSKEQYNQEKVAGRINDNEIYMTPAENVEHGMKYVEETTGVHIEWDGDITGRDACTGGDSPDATDTIWGYKVSDLVFTEDEIRSAEILLSNGVIYKGEFYSLDGGVECFGGIGGSEGVNIALISVSNPGVHIDVDGYAFNTTESGTYFGIHDESEIYIASLSTEIVNKAIVQEEEDVTSKIESIAGGIYFESKKDFELYFDGDTTDKVAATVEDEDGEHVIGYKIGDIPANLLFDHGGTVDLKDADCFVGYQVDITMSTNGEVVWSGVVDDYQTISIGGYKYLSPSGEIFYVFTMPQDGEYVASEAGIYCLYSFNPNDPEQYVYTSFIGSEERKNLIQHGEIVTEKVADLFSKAPLYIEYYHNYDLKEYPVEKILEALKQKKEIILVNNHGDGWVYRMTNSSYAGNYINIKFVHDESNDIYSEDDYLEIEKRVLVYKYEDNQVTVNEYNADLLTSENIGNSVAPLEDGKVPTDRLPEMNYVPTTRKINGETLDHDLTISGLPDVTSADNGKALTVQNGTWAVGSVITYKEV